MWVVTVVLPCNWLLEPWELGRIWARCVDLLGTVGSEADVKSFGGFVKVRATLLSCFEHLLKRAVMLPWGIET